MDEETHEVLEPPQWLLRTVDAIETYLIRPFNTYVAGPIRRSSTVRDMGRKVRLAHARSVRNRIEGNRAILDEILEDPDNPSVLGYPVVSGERYRRLLGADVQETRIPGYGHFSLVGWDPTPISRVRGTDYLLFSLQSSHPWGRGYGTSTRNVLVHEDRLVERRRMGPPRGMG